MMDRWQRKWKDLIIKGMLYKHDNPESQGQEAVIKPLVNRTSKKQRSKHRLL